ncbi:unnamed protein product [Cyprideis torosa]|uniref:Uncharacterized protein n=1 Tax=Cyprideis torosa TaxID=163714 RepID=A0A7R8ZIZ4_9CRUS|nr:unnamed protein product [Cyprideis torosa]CAG0887433.1 unnamed protein product [Cyprideis torosa]
MGRHVIKEHEGGLEIDPDFSKEVECKVCGKKVPKFRQLSHQRLHKNFPCTVCGKILKSYEARKKHNLAFHQETKEVQCELCGKVVAEFNMKSHHFEFHNPTFDPTCPVCHKVFKRRSSAMKHQRAVHGDGGEFVCSTCGKRCLSESRLKTHEDVHKEVKQNVCQTCGKSFTSSYNFRKHVARDHEGGLAVHPEFSKEVECDICHKVVPFYQLYSHRRGHKGYPCGVCDKVLRTSGNRTQHMARVHAAFHHKSVDRVECEVCGKSVRQFDLKSHMTTYHDPHCSLKCPECDKTLANKASLKRHRDFVHGDAGSNFVCSHCGRKCWSQAMLRQHEESHSDLKRHVCDSCGKAFKYKDQLTRHVTLDHKGMNPYKCPKCGKVYRTPLRLKDHMNLHLEIKPCICAVCGQAFATRSRLDTHRKKHRKE